MSTVQAMEWRYATKKFDLSKRLNDEQVQQLLEVVRLAPSSFGLQPYTVLLVKDAEVRQRLSEAAMGQPQITAASHLLVFAADGQVGTQAVSNFIDRAAATRKMPREQLTARETQILGAVNKLGPEDRLAWAQKQAYLALGVLLTAAAQARIDACPMEGFDGARVDDILGLSKQGLKATVFVTLGMRAGDDPFAGLAKVRKPAQEMFISI